MVADRQNQEKVSQPSTSAAPQPLQSRPLAPPIADELEAVPELRLQKRLQPKPEATFTFGRTGSNSDDAPVLPTPSRNLLQAKLTIGQPGDQYEQEADRVAAQVVQRTNLLKSNPSKPALQRQELKEEDELQMKPEISMLQRQEAEEEDELQMKPEISMLQRQEAEEEDELQMKPLQRQKSQEHEEASADLETSINSARGRGQSLESGLQQQMGQAMAADFSGVKVHTDATADRLSQSIQAKAFTTGKDIFFKGGEYNPSSQSGQELLAHELTHVVQQTGRGDAPVQRDALTEEEELQMKPMSGQGILDRKLPHGVSQNGGLVQQKQNLIQRKINRIEGVSSVPWQGKRDKLNILADKYNAKEEEHLTSQTTETLQLELKAIDNMLQEAEKWKQTVSTKEDSTFKKLVTKKEKREEKKVLKIQEIQAWIATVEAEKIKKQKQYRLEQEQYQLEQEQHQLEAVQRIYKASSQFEANVSPTKPIKRLNQLEQLAADCRTWLSFPSTANSTHRKGVENVAEFIKKEIEATKAKNSLSEVEDNDFSDANRTKSELFKESDGKMSEVFKETYKFDVTTGQTKDYKLDTGKEFTGYFKADVESIEDVKYSRSRVEDSGIPQDKPKFTERNIAMYKLDKLLNAGVIPPTFRAKNGETAGLVMQEVVGKQLKWTLDPYGEVIKGREDVHAILTSGVARKALSRLYLLDVIAGQVDRHYGNVIIELEKDESGKEKAVGVKGIDNDQSFGGNYTNIEYGDKQYPKYNPTCGRLAVAGLRAQELEEIDMDFALSIMNLVSKENEVRTTLKGLITLDEIDATVSRLKSLADFLGDLFKGGSNKLKTAGDWEDKAVKK
jgi:Domain of unknown function (DUF4157)